MALIQTAAVLSSPPAVTGYVSDLDTPLLMFNEFDVYDLRSAASGILCMGGTGSGKSSSSGALIARSYLKAGFGGLVLCVNTDEADRWRRYAAETNRTQSLVIMDGSLAHRFNFLEYQMAVGHGSVSEAVNVLVEILDAAEGRVAEKADGNAFWDTAMRQLLTNAIGPLWAAYGRLTLVELMKFVHDRPRTREEASPDHPKRSFWHETMELAVGHGVFPMEREDFFPAFDYWGKEMTQADQRTPGNIIQTLSARLGPFLSGPLRKLFATYSSFVPELCFEGAVLVLDISAHEWGTEGILAQHIVKRMWQTAMQRRPKTPDARPCFLFVDECQYFLSKKDQEFQSTSRGCRGLTVYLTQSLAGVYAKIGGNAEHIADALLGNLATTIMHAQPDAKTCAWMAERIGKAVTWRRNAGESENSSTGASTSTNSSSAGGKTSHSSGGGTTIGEGRGSSWGASEVVDYRLQPSHFTTLKKGGGADRVSEAVIFEAGRVFAYTRSTWTPALFRQE